MSTIPAISEICDQFRLAWAEGERPLISDYLIGADDKRRKEIIAALIEVEITLRRESGEDVEAVDYAAYGPEGVSVACQIMLCIEFVSASTVVAIGMMHSIAINIGCALPTVNSR